LARLRRGFLAIHRFRLLRVTGFQQRRAELMPDRYEPVGRLIVGDLILRRRGVAQRRDRLLVPPLGRREPRLQHDRRQRQKVFGAVPAGAMLSAVRSNVTSNGLVSSTRPFATSAAARL
jgi:hypothetical protein